MSRYQGIVALEGQGLEEAAHQYFRQSEQIPTACGSRSARSWARQGRGTWRAGGLIVQFLPTSPERRAQADLPPGDAPDGRGADDRRSARTTPGSRRARWSRRSRTTSWSIPR